MSDELLPNPPETPEGPESHLLTPLRPHQLRAIEKLKASGGLLAAHGLGSGKTLTSIAAGDALGLPIDAVVPAPLIGNYEKELHKHLSEVPEETRIRSYQKATRDKDINPNALVVLDEAHKIRNRGTQMEQEVARRAAEAKARLLLTATPVYNNPTDLSSLLNTAAGKEIVPNDPMAFKDKYIGERVVKPGLWGRMWGVKDSFVPAMKNQKDFVNAVKGYVDVHHSGGEDFPDRIEEKHEIPLSQRQWQHYQFHEGKVPWHVSYKIRHGMPLSKQESEDLNAFSGALRQVSNTPRPYMTGMTDEQELEDSPKLKMIAEHFRDMQKKNPNHRGVIYSNYLGGGLNPMSRALTSMGVQNAMFHGGLNKKDKDALVQAYNSGKLPALLVSSAGTEGLDLKGTNSIQIAEPHWNDSKIEQVIGRGIRYKSHSDLPEDQRKVHVHKYYSTLPKSFFGLKDNGKGIEQYMQEMSDNKSQLGRDFLKALEDASNEGPLKPPVATQPKTAEDAPEDTRTWAQRHPAMFGALSAAIPGAVGGGLGAVRYHSAIPGTVTGLGGLLAVPGGALGGYLASRTKNPWARAAIPILGYAPHVMAEHIYGLPNDVLGGVGVGAALTSLLAARTQLHTPEDRATQKTAALYGLTPETLRSLARA